MNETGLAATASRSGPRRRIMLLAVISFGLCCAMGGTPASSQSLGDRFKSLFGGTSDQPPPPKANPDDSEPDLTCPTVSIRAGASTYAVGNPGKDAVGSDLRYQATITRTARDCNLSAGQITARIGIQGRVIVGPAGAPSSVELPLRVAVVKSGVQEKIIATKAYHTTVALSDDNSVPFTMVAEDLVYPAPPGADADNYIFYIGFDPQALKPAPPPPRKGKKK